jgi:hypothetical protein
LAFLIEITRRSSSPSPRGVQHHHQTPARGAEGLIALLAVVAALIRQRRAARISEHLGGILEIEAMLLQVRRPLGPIVGDAHEFT